MNRKTAAAVLAIAVALSAAHAQTKYQRIKSFGFPEYSEANPNGLIEGSDGALYGTTRTGGTNGSGTVFKLNKDGSSYRVLYRFTGAPGDGKTPMAALVEGSDGVLYGTTAAGGITNESSWGGFGTVFKLDSNGSGYTVIRRFTQSSGDGSVPLAALIEGSDGALYGTTSEGAGNYGTAFKVNKDGSGYAVLHRFTGGGDGVRPEAALVEGSDGLLYGTTVWGGSGGFDHNFGTLFKLHKDGSGYAVLHSFTAYFGDGAYPRALIEGSDGILYGTTQSRGALTGGTVFKIHKSGSGFLVLRSFPGTEGDGIAPQSLLESSDGALYGTTELGGTTNAGTVFKLNKDGSGYAVLRSFASGRGWCNIPGSDGASIIIEGSDGILYGAAPFNNSDGAGNVFRLNKEGDGYLALHQFIASGGDGSHPLAGLMEGSDGVLYGTTSSGGTNNVGTVFRVERDGRSYMILYHVGSSTRLVEARDGTLHGTIDGFVAKLKKDGSAYSNLYFVGDDALLVAGSDGALYGTASGGTNGLGIVFKLNNDGSGYAELHSFTGIGGDGSRPNYLIEGSNGILYGTTENGGTNDLGTVFKLGKDGSGYAVLRSFTAIGEDGSHPHGLTEGRGGTLYGTTRWGGIYGSPEGHGGTIFRLKKDGSGYALLYRFGSGDEWAGFPTASLVEGGDGALYGTDSCHCRSAENSVFRLNKDGTGYMALHRFCNWRFLGSCVSQPGDGSVPSGVLLKGGDGSLYGTTSDGGEMNCGTVFKLISPLLICRIEVIQAGAFLSFCGGAAGQAYQIEAKTDFSEPWWEVIGSQTAGIDGRFEFVDTGASNYPVRFYRTVTP